MTRQNLWLCNKLLLSELTIKILSFYLQTGKTRHSSLLVLHDYPSQTLTIRSRIDSENFWTANQPSFKTLISGRRWITPPSQFEYAFETWIPVNQLLLVYRPKWKWRRGREWYRGVDHVTSERGMGLWIKECVAFVVKTHLRGKCFINALWLLSKRNVSIDELAWISE